jgi:hypothetical protein
MKTRLFTMLSVSTSSPKAQHYIGVPPVLTDGEETRRKMGRARVLLIQENADGVFLYRYDETGVCVGDTWHMNIDDAKHQAAYEYEDQMEDWRDVLPEIEDAIAFSVARARSTSETQH